MKKDKRIIKFLRGVMFYARKGYPLPVAFKKALIDHKIKGINRNYLYELSRRFLLHYTFMAEANTTDIASNLPLSLPSRLAEELSKYIPNFDEFLRTEDKSKWFWINTNIVDEDKALHVLEEQGYEIEQDKDFKFLYKVLKEKKPLQRTDMFRNLQIVIQDKASVAVVVALNPEPDDIIIDFASAPGIKDILIQKLTENKAKIIGADVNISRLKREELLLKKAKIKNVDLVNQDSQFDSIRFGNKGLFDAPCGSSGMIVEEPTVLMRLEKDKNIISRYSKLQKNILLKILNKKNSLDYLIYSVCSLFPEEGESHFENDYIYKLTERPLSIAHDGYQGFRVSQYSARFYPHLDGTYGFFITKIRFK